MAIKFTLSIQQLERTTGGYTAGFGLATTLNNATPTSAFIIQADKFAVVPSSYSGGLTNTPPSGNLPFVIDAGTGNDTTDTLRVNVTPTAETPTATHTAVFNIDGTNYKFLCLPA